MPWQFETMLRNRDVWFHKTEINIAGHFKVLLENVLTSFTKYFQFLFCVILQWIQWKYWEYILFSNTWGLKQTLLTVGKNTYSKLSTFKYAGGSVSCTNFLKCHRVTYCKVLTMFLNIGSKFSLLGIYPKGYNYKIQHNKNTFRYL